MFCSLVVYFYFYFIKFCLDIFVICWILDGMVRKRGILWKVLVIIVVVVIYFIVEILRKLSFRFGKIVVEELQWRGQFRFFYFRVIINVEEIVFYGGYKVGELYVYVLIINYFGVLMNN